MKTTGCNHTFRLTTLVCVLAIFFSATIMPAEAADKPKPTNPPPSGPGGSGIMPGQDCFITGSRIIPEVCADYKISWKLWTLVGEPVGDYRLKWKLKSFKIASDEGKDEYAFMGSDDVREFQMNITPPELKKAVKSIELYLDGEAQVGMGEGVFFADAEHAFNTGVATRAGQLSVNTPGSPKWGEMFLEKTKSFDSAHTKYDDSRSYMSAEDAKALFKKSHQPGKPLKLWNFKVGPKSSVTGLDALGNRINQLCSNPKTAPHYRYCPAIKKKTKKKADKAETTEDKTNKDGIDDAFAELDKGNNTSSPGSSDDAFSGLDKGETTKAGYSVDDSFAEVEAYHKEVERQAAIKRELQARHDEAVRFCDAEFSAQASCFKDTCGGEPKKTVCSEYKPRYSGGCGPNTLCLTPYDCVSTEPNPAYSKWELCTAQCKRGASAGSMEECISQRESTRDR